MSSKRSRNQADIRLLYFVGESTRAGEHIKLHNCFDSKKVEKYIIRCDAAPVDSQGK